jgi:8-oxo-dGTP pyrophosphatase MutT (NUDIX family)
VSYQNIPTSHPLPAATILLLRNSSEQIKVFMQQRSYQASFVGGAFVFPGGKVDEQDSYFSEAYLKLPKNDEQKVVFQKPNALRAAIAAIRECFEEARVLLAYDDNKDSNDELLSIETESEIAEYELFRNKLNANEISFEDLCQQKGLRLAIDRLVFLGHWVTPESSAQRFDTLFFACESPENQEGIHDDYESIESVWWGANEALAKFKKGEIQLIYPTVISLEHMQSFKTAQDFIEHQRLGLTVLGR